MILIKRKLVFVPGRVPLQLVQLVLRAGLYVGIYRTGALVQYLLNAEMQYPKINTNKAIKSQTVQYFQSGTSKIHDIPWKISINWPNLSQRSLRLVEF